MRRLIILAAVVLAVVSASAQGFDTWLYHPSFGTGIQDIFDTGDDVYYLVDGNLFRYDKDTEESEALYKGNYLSDSNITGIYFNYDNKALVVVYSNSNIDVISNGHLIYNLPQIKSLETIYSKTINDINFDSEGNIYVATDFGYVVYDFKTMEVDESRFFYSTGTNSATVSVKSVAVVGNNLLISANDRLYIGDKSRHYDDLSQMSSQELISGKIRPINDTRFFCHSYVLYVCELNGNNLSKDAVTWRTATSVQRTGDGFVANFTKDNFIITFGANGDYITTIPDIGNEIYSSHDGNGSWWALGTEGIHQIESDGSSSSYIKPNSLSMSEPFHMAYNDAQNMLYVTGRATNALFGTSGPATTVNTMTNNSWKDVTPQPVIDKGGNYEPVFDPSDPDTYYLPTWTGGIYKITDGEIAMVYDWNNSPMIFIDNYYCHPTIAFDKGGNLWVVQTDNANSYVMVLPKSKLTMTSVTESDWIKPKISGLIGNKRSQFVVTNSNIKVFANGDDEKDVIIWDDGGNPSSASIRSRSFNKSNTYDQDNKQYEWRFVYDMVVDQNNRVWMVTNNGVISFDPAAILAGTGTINRTKVPRNDGTNLADYLLDGQQVNCIAVDGSNRKWIGTNSAGAFLVSEDGSQILRQFNTQNSAIPSDRIYQICCDPNSNSVYFTTEAGFVEYFSNATPPQSDYSNILAYPNPVRPDYTGPITITGLMENSYIKIADAAGNVVATVRSNGGMATWDGCNYSGRRVKSGVYFVFVSRGTSDGGSGSAVTKILVMN
ncbi:MAG: hypothetical protein IJ626_02110 [Muribaculaceae bacterium]|nr:hypothetical protein [Muribaculaceae bacterium]